MARLKGVGSNLPTPTPVICITSMERLKVTILTVYFIKITDYYGSLA